MRKRVVTLAVFLILSLIIFTFSSVISYPFDFFSHLLSTPRALFYSAAFGEAKPSEMDKLKEENLSLTQKLAQMNAIKQDNNALRSQFLDTFIPPQSLLPAHVVGFSGPPGSPTSLILDQGLESGVKTGMAVVETQNLVGKIGKVTAWNSELVLPVNKDFSTLAVTSQNNSPGLVNGEDDFILLNHVVITDSLSKNETVVTKGEENINGVGIPAGLVLGKVQDISKSEAQPFQSAIVKSLIDFNKLTTVFIVLR